MNGRASQLDRLIAATRRRLLIADAVRLGGLWLTISATSALLLALVDRFTAVDAPWWMIALVSAMGLPIACAIAWLRRGAGMAAAVTLDEGLRLKDRLGTAMALDTTGAGDLDNPMREWVRQDAETLAARVDPRSVARIGWPITWGSGVLVGAACAALLLFVEPRDVFASRTDAEQVAVQSARQRAAESLRQRAEQLRQAQEEAPSASAPVDTEARQQALDTLDRLAKQFESPTEPGAKSGGGARDGDAELSAAAREAMELADRLDRQSQIERAAQQRALDRLAAMEPPVDQDQSPGAEPFAQSLGKGDVESAGRWLEQLEEQLKDAPPERRQEMADSLRETAEQVRQSAADETSNEASAPSPEQQRLDDLDLPPEQIEQWHRQQPSTDEIRQKLIEQGRDPLDAQQLAEQAQRDLAEQSADRRAREQLEQTARRISDLADVVENPPSEPAAEKTAENANSAQREPQGTPPDQPPTQTQRPDAKPDAPQEPQSGKPGDGKSAPNEQTQDGKPKAPDRPGEQNKPGSQSQPSNEPGQQAGESGENQHEKPAEGEAGEQTPPDQQGEPGSEPTQKQPGEPAPSGDSQQTGKGKESGGQESGGKDESGKTTEPAPRDAQSSEPAAEPDGATHPEGATEPKGTPQAEPSDSQDTEPGAKAADAPKQGETRPGAAEPNAGEEGSDTSRDGAAPAPGAESGEPSTDAPPRTVGENVQRLREVLDHIDRSGRSADHSQKISQEMRDTAKQLLEQMSPQERQELERWAAEQARQNGDSDGIGPSPDSPLDRRLPTQAIDNERLFDYETQRLNAMGDREPGSDRVIAEMYGSEEDRPQGAIDRQPMQSAPMREAARAVERALNEEAIPPRYRALIRNWARRLPQPEGAPAKASPQTKDP